MVPDAAAVSQFRQLLADFGGVEGRGQECHSSRTYGLDAQFQTVGIRDVQDGYELARVLVDMGQLLQQSFDVGYQVYIGNQQRRQAALQCVERRGGILLVMEFDALSPDDVGEGLQGILHGTHQVDLVRVDRRGFAAARHRVPFVVRGQLGEQAAGGLALVRGQRHIHADKGAQVNFRREGGIRQR